MPRFQSSREVAFTPQQMFDLVADVQAYPQFLPLCEDLRIRRTVKSSEGLDVLVADMTVGYKAIRETFTSRVTLDPAQLQILVTYLEGPFSHLDNRWHFVPSAKGCRVEFYIDYEFRSRMLGVLMGAMFDKAFRKFSEAFEARAAQIYPNA
jgi:coenzyme Q-binding protein COQ10